MINKIQLKEIDIAEKLKNLFTNLDNYLITDLDRMISIEKGCMGGFGRLNYPMMMTILAAMELLGQVLSIDERRCRSAFKNFWESFFIKYVKDKDKYNNSMLADILYGCVRNGLAHSFMPKSKIYLTKAGTNVFSRRNDGRLSIDVVTFYEDFKIVYYKIKEGLFINETLKSENYLIGYNSLLHDMKNEINKVENYLNSKNLPVTQTMGSPAHEVS
ncbi:MAG: hypothetical protein NT170_03495 [Candidatus Moranbacteria bacterium]|nr:hypothetical protein [Candidatus Moranbacteria bacterium]